MKKNPFGYFKKKKSKSEPERQIVDREVIKLLQELKGQLVKGYRQETLSFLDEECNNALKQFKSTVGRRCWKLAQRHCQWGEDFPILQPNHSRLFYRKGHTDIMVVEEEPRVRTLRFNSSFDSQQGSYNLALPYVVFIFRFIDRCFCDVYCMFNDKPLGDLSERPMSPYLTNINSDLKVCLGSSFHLPSNLQYSQVVGYTLNYFWSAEHTHEWTEHWNNNVAFFAKRDGRLATLSAWQEATQQNSLFVIDDVSWRHHTRSIGDLIVGLTKTDTKAREFEEIIFKDLINEFVAQVATAMSRALEQGSNKVSSEPPEIVERKLVKAMQKFKIMEEL